VRSLPNIVLRDLIKGPGSERQQGEPQLEFSHEIPVSLWSLRDGCVLILQSSPSCSHSDNTHHSSSELESFYNEPFMWKRSKNPVGTQQNQFDLLCDLVIRSRGVFSDFPYNVEMVLNFVGMMAERYGCLHHHINEVRTKSGQMN
jgi:hypothetical protein